MILGQYFGKIQFCVLCQGRFAAPHQFYCQKCQSKPIFCPMTQSHAIFDSKATKVSSYYSTALASIRHGVVLTNKCINAYYRIRLSTLV